MDLTVEPTEEGMKRRWAKVAVLRSLEQRGPLTEKELKTEANHRNYNQSLVFGNSVRANQIPRCFNHILSKNISSGYITKKDVHNLSEKTTYELTQKGETYIDQLFEETVAYLD